MRTWQWVALGLLVVALVALVFPLLRTQKELRAVEGELKNANDQLVQARSEATDLERVIANLKTQLDVATRAQSQLQGSLNEANSEIEQITQRQSSGKQTASASTFGKN
jgi:septal ring factor EnvC (AmiA/AmiB activator)